MSEVRSVPSVQTLCSDCQRAGHKWCNCLQPESGAVEDGKSARVRIIRANLRETGSEGVATWDAYGKWWRVNLDRNEPPYRGIYEPNEVEVLP